MKINSKKILATIIIILVITICCGVWAIILYNKEAEIIAKKESQALTSATQLAIESDSKNEQQNEIDEKMKSILVGVLRFTGEMEEKYDNEKVDNIIKDFNSQKGIFISNRAKDKIIELLKETTNIEYQVDNNSYLKNNENKETNDISKSINSMIKSNKNIIIDYNPYYYCKLGEDICTFNIEETVYMEKFKQDDTIIMILNPTKYEQEYESNSDLVNQIINNVNS